MESTIKECIDSILDQHLKNYEIIVVNDGSTDNTGKIVKKYKNIKLINNKKSGVSKTRNIGIKEAKGEIVIFIDADCVVKKDAINILIEFLEKNKDTVGVSGVAYSYDRNSIIGLSHEARLFEYSVLEKKSREVKFIAGMICGFKRDVLLKLEGYDENLSTASEDSDLSLRARKYGRLYLVPNANVLHHHPTNIINLWKKWCNYGVTYAKFSKKNQYYKDIFLTLIWMSMFSLSFISAIVLKNFILLLAAILFFLSPWFILYFPNTFRYLLKYKKPQALLFIIPHNIQILARSIGILLGFFK